MGERRGPLGATLRCADIAADFGDPALIDASLHQFERADDALMPMRKLLKS